MLTPVDIEERLNSLDHRLDRVEQILPTLVTKEDLRQALENYPTKDDLRRALENYPTKADLTEAIGQAFEIAQKDARIMHEHLVEQIKLLGEGRRRRRS